MRCGGSESHFFRDGGLWIGGTLIIDAPFLLSRVERLYISEELAGG